MQLLYYNVHRSHILNFWWLHSSKVKILISGQLTPLLSVSWVIRSSLYSIYKYQFKIIFKLESRVIRLCFMQIFFCLQILHKTFGLLYSVSYSLFRGNLISTKITFSYHKIRLLLIIIYYLHSILDDKIILMMGWWYILS